VPAALRATSQPAATSGDAARRPLAPWTLAVTVLTGQAMASLDSAIVNVAAPAIQHDLGLSGPELQLSVYSYLLAYAVALVTGARLGARHGFGRLFTWGIAVFTISSAVCGLAADPVMLVAARTIQGAGAALLVPQVLSLLRVTFDGQGLRRAMSGYGLVLAVGVAAGQVLGGILVTSDLFGTGWRPVFLVNVPVGLAALACTAGRLPSGPSTPDARLDLGGAGMLAAGILALIIPLTFGADAGWPFWSWPVLASGAVALTAFAAHEGRLARHGRDPLIDPALLRRTGIRAGLAGIFTLHASYGGLLFTTAIYLQHALGDSPLTSGLTFAGYATGFATASLTWTKIRPAWQPRLPQAAFTTFAATAGLLAWLTSARSWPWPATALLVLAGAAHGTGFGTLVHRTTAAVPPTNTATFSGVLATTNQLAIVTGIAAAGTLYMSAARFPGLPPMPAVLLALASAQAVTGTIVSVTLARTCRRATHHTAAGRTRPADCRHRATGAPEPPRRQRVQRCLRPGQGPTDPPPDRWAHPVSGADRQRARSRFHPRR
jgi:MFS family permease